MRRLRTAPLLAAFAAVGMASVWMTLTVQANYGGDWSSLFYTGASWRVPPELESEGTYRFAGSTGYDAQYYHLVAHDPLITRGFARYVDNPRMRWRRILVPGLASLAGDDYADSLYVCALLLFVGLGAYWMGLWCKQCGRTGWFGLLFLAAPATLISIDRATVDVALASLTVAFALFQGRALCYVLALAPLARETGLLLVGGQALWRARARQWKACVPAALALVPFLAWSVYVGLRTAPDLTSHLEMLPFGGIARRAFHYAQYPFGTPWLRTAALLDYVAFLGVCLCFLLAAMRWRSGRLELASALFCGAMAFVGQPQVWAEAYAFGRIASPVVLLLALIAVRDRWWWGLLPWAMLLPRVLWQLGPQWKGLLRWVL